MLSSTAAFAFIIRVLFVNFKGVFGVHTSRQVLALAVDVVQQCFESLVNVDFVD